MKAKRSPYSAGFNGHAFKCTCTRCLKSKASAFDELDSTMKIEPKSLAATVLVRAHYRYHPGHMKGDPKARALQRRLLSKLRR